jgi:hypothetical protein
VKIRVFANTDVIGVRGNPFEVDDPTDCQRVRVTHAGEEYELAASHGRLELRRIGGGQLVIKPSACNLVEIESMQWPPRDANEPPPAKQRRKGGERG